MNPMLIFQLSAAILCGLFIYYGMDVRCKPEAHDLVAPVWQVVMKLLSFALLGGFAWILMAMRTLGPLDWLALSIIAIGTAFVAAAKITLGKSHTFTGQYLERTKLVTHGVYSITRNPLYLGVFLCESGATLCAAGQIPDLMPGSYQLFFFAMGAALAYVVGFNWIMALREENRLELAFGSDYRRYCMSAPFLIPHITWIREGKS